MTDLIVPDCVNDAGDAIRMQTLPLLDFGDVIKGLAKGRRYARIAWCGHRLIYREGCFEEIYACNNVQLIRVRVWTPSPLDLTATDWIEVID
jgi:hypothetical protein